MMKQKRTSTDLVCIALCFLALTGVLFSQVPDTKEGAKTDPPIKYFRVDKVITVAGTVTAIKSEKNYDSKKSDFVVAYVNDKKSGEQYKIELSPAWYFNLDIMVGSRVRITGSHNRINGQHLLMTQSLVFQGDIFHFRDKSGFPLWRGKSRKIRENDNRLKRKQKGAGGSGKGKH